MPRRWTLATVAAVAAEERAELGFPIRSEIDPYRVAEHHGIECYPIDSSAPSAKPTPPCTTS